MKKSLLLAASSSLLALTLFACGGGGGGGQALLITLCNLGCNQSSGIYNCGPSAVQVHENEAIVVQFNAPVNINSVNKNTFRVTDSAGVAPVGEYRLGSSPNVVIYRPVTTFGPSGEPDFGFEQGQAYTVEIPGKAQDSAGPWILSADGSPNSISLECTVVADQGVLDVVPGNPLVDVVVTQVTAYQNNDPTQNPTAFQDKIANAGTELSNVSRETEIEFVFDDLMNPVSIVSDPVNGESQTIFVRLDPDGDTGDPSDQVALFGTFLPPILDTDTQTTSLVFRLSKGLPSAGGVPILPGDPIPSDKRRVVIELIGGSGGVRDLAGNPLANSGFVTFVPEVITFAQVTLPIDPSGLGERFLTTSTNRSNADTAAGMWGASETLTQGLLATGPSTGVAGEYFLAPGGSGRLGRLVVGPGETRTLGTNGVLLSTIGGIAVAAVDSPFVALSSDGGGGVIETPVPAVGRVVWDQLQIFGREPDWAFLGEPGPPMMAVQIEAQDPFHPGEFSPVWVGNDGMTPLTMDVLVATYTNTFLIDNYDPLSELPGTGSYSASGAYAGDGFGSEGVGADGVFEFASVILRSGGRLTFQGDSPARVFARGDLEVRGVLDVSGGDAPSHRSNRRLGSASIEGGPGGGAGGRGGDRFDHGRGAFEFLSSMALPTPGLITPADAIGENLFGIDNVDDFVLEGAAGDGIGGAGTSQGGGSGGVSWPVLFPGEVDASTYTGTLVTFGDWAADAISCRSPQLATPGGGGAYTPNGWGLNTNGGNGTPQTSHSGVFADTINPIPPLPPAAPRGDTASIVYGDLDPDADLLIGGSGGGGAGTHIRLTKTNGQTFFNCKVLGALMTPPVRIIEYSDHSGCAGGGGGGAIQAQAGRLLTMNGIIDATGGRGGSFDPTGGPFDDYLRQAMPGGGGSGGAVLAQATSIQLASLAGRVNVSGGIGGSGGFSTRGGDGGAGRLRFEVPSFSTQDLDFLRQNAITSDIVVPGISEFPVSYPAELVTSGELMAPTSGPGAFSGAQSCWMQPQGNFFQVDFLEDGASLGWDVDVVLAGIQTSFRKIQTSGPFTGMSIEEVFGARLRDPDEVATIFNASPIVIRFQGARAVANLTDPCNVDLDGPVVLEDSLTPWVYHPAELNDYWDNFPGVTASQAIQRRSNMIRFQVIFDDSHPFSSVIAGVTNLRVFALPD